MEEFVKYIKSLEQRLAALETAEAQEAAQEALIASLEARIAGLEARVAELEARPLAEEPEVEVEFEFDESPIEEEEEETIAPEPEPVEEPEPDPEPEPEPEPIEEEEEAPAKPFDAAVGAPVDDMRKAISLGDRFLFVRELFAGKGEMLQIVIDEINGMSSVEEANAYLDKHFHWDKESKAYELFQNVLKRRFS